MTALQDGKRFSLRRVRGSQSGGRFIFDAQASFAVPLAAPSHAAPVEPLALLEAPENLPRLSELPAVWGTEVTRAPGYALVDKPAVDFCLPAALGGPNGLCLSLPEPRLRFWLKTSHALPDPPMVHAAAFAYLSDWWLNYTSVGGHLQALGPEQGLYVASLNHTIWWHRPFRADEWLHFDCRSPASGAGRGLTMAHGSRPQRPTRGERHAGMPDGPARRLTIACVRRGGGERCDGVLGSVHVIRRRRCGHLLLLYFSPRSTPPQRS